MSEPRIKVKLSVFGGYFWRCKQPGVVKCTPSVLGMTGRADTIAAVADAGRRHLAEHHDATWLVAACECGVYPDPGICHCAGPGKTHCACSHSPICAIRNALRTTFDTTRSDS